MGLQAVAGICGVVGYGVAEEWGGFGMAWGWVLLAGVAGYVGVARRKD